jgi:hypothetical protein
MGSVCTVVQMFASGTLKMQPGWLHTTWAVYCDLERFPWLLQFRKRERGEREKKPPSVCHWDDLLLCIAKAASSSFLAPPPDRRTPKLPFAHQRQFSSSTLTRAKNLNLPASLSFSFSFSLSLFLFLFSLSLPLSLYLSFSIYLFLCSL